MVVLFGEKLAKLQLVYVSESVLGCVCVCVRFQAIGSWKNIRNDDVVYFGE